MGWKKRIGLAVASLLLTANVSAAQNWDVAVYPVLVWVPLGIDINVDVPPFDFAVPGVASISADLHKSGFAAKPASTVSFRTRAHREFARYSFDDWPSGGYSSLTFTGTRASSASIEKMPSSISRARLRSPSEPSTSRARPRRSPFPTRHSMSSRASSC